VGANVDSIMLNPFALRKVDSIEHLENTKAQLLNLYLNKPQNQDFCF
jgi:hypothetical protein